MGSKEFLRDFTWVASITLIISFICGEDKVRLISGGLILILFGFIQYFIPGIKANKPGMMLVGVLEIFSGLIAVYTAFISQMGIDAYVLAVLVVLICIIFFYYKFENRLKLGKLIAIPALLIMALALTFTISSLINSIKDAELINPQFYFASVVFILLINAIYFILIKNILTFLGMKQVEYFSLALAITIFVIVSGYYYINNVSENKMRDFLLILSIGFVTVWGAISSFKEIFSKRD